ncbi:MAG: hypothetical protein RLZZ444_2151 [Pseudomonadota bacterium]|jgi:hypothetical protein
MLKARTLSSHGTPLRYDAGNRLVSASFQRDPSEYADIVLTSDRFTQPGRKLRFWQVAVSALTAGSAVGLAMEAYRRFLLPDLVDTAIIPPLPVVVLQFLPFVLLIVAAALARSWYQRGRKRRALIAQFAPDQFIDIDIYENGIEASHGDIITWLPWTSVREVAQVKGRIEIIGETFVTYLPERAFPDTANFRMAAAQIELQFGLSRPAPAPAETVTVAPAETEAPSQQNAA